MSNPPSDLEIEQLRAEDIPAVLETFTMWHKTQEQLGGYLAEQDRGERTVFLAWLDGKIIGGLNVLWQSALEIPDKEQFAQIINLDVIEPYSFTDMGNKLCEAGTEKASQSGLSVFVAEIETFPIENVQKWGTINFFPVLFREMTHILFIRPLTDDDSWRYSLWIDGSYVFSELEPLEVLRSFTFDMSAPANSILGYTQLIQRGLLPNEKWSVESVAATIQSNARRLIAMSTITRLYTQLHKIKDNE